MATTAITETFYLTRDNSVDLLLKIDGVVADLTAVTKVEVSDVKCAWSVNSEDSPSAFSWNKILADGKLTLKLGQEPILPKSYTCRITMYDPTNSHGVVWGEIILVFKKACTVVV